MYGRLSTELTVLVDRVSAIEPDTLMSLVTLTCLWVIWTIYVWTKHPFSPWARAQRAGNWPRTAPVRFVAFSFRYRGTHRAEGTEKGRMAEWCP